MQQYTEPFLVEPPTSGSLTDALLMHAQNQPQKATMVRRIGDQWIELTAPEFLQLVRRVAKGLVACGIKPGDRVAIMSRTRFEWTVVDCAALYFGAITVPIYESSSAEQVHWILSDSAATAVVVEHAAHLAKVEDVRPNLPNLHHTWVFDHNALDELVQVGNGVSDEEIDRLHAEVTPAAVASIIYTSGTTGLPKGCTLTHLNLMTLVRNVRLAVPEVLMDPQGTTLLFLPLAHVFGRLIQFAFIEAGLKLAFSPDMAQLVPDLQKFQPTFVLAVPRVFEKVYNSAEQRAVADGKGKIFHAAAGVAIAYSKAIEEGSIPVSLKLRHALFDKLVYGKLRAALGGQVKYAISGGAALGSRLGHFFRGIGMVILEGYGLTETTAGSALNRPTMIKVGTVGRALPGVSFAIAADGEVLIKGVTVFAGYWNNPTATAEAIDADGWFHTGDLGSIDHQGYLSITGRKKELIVTAGGKNVAPAVLEDRLRAHWLVSQCMVVGDGKPFIGCLITVDRDSLPQWLTRHNRAANTTIAQLSHDAEFLAEIQAAVDHANKVVSQAESIRKFALVDQDWTEAGGQMTPSLKLKRNIVAAECAEQIEALYR